MRNKVPMIKWGMTLAASCCLAFPAVAAQSANYSAPPGVFANGGLSSSSASFKQTGVLGYTFAQAGSSASYQGGIAIGALLPPLLSAVLNLNTATLTFASQNVGVASAAQTVTLSNTGTAALSISNMVASGDFAQGNNCGTSVAVGASCTLTITFAPTVAGARTGAVSITSNVSANPVVISLAGTGVLPPPAIVMNLAASWNLLGNSVNAPLTVATTFGNVANVSTVWKWVPATSRWAFYTPSLADGGAAYAAGKGYDFLTVINGGEGFWVNAKTAFTAQLPVGVAVSSSAFADQPTPPNNLPLGWSLIAIGDSRTPKTFASAISAATPTVGVVPSSFTTLWAWDSALLNWYFYAPSLDNTGGLQGYITTKGYLNFGTKLLDPGTGFWVNHP
jgi:hypothetical protein